MASSRSYVEPWIQTPEDIRRIISTRKAIQAQDASVKRERPMYRTLTDQRAREGLRRVVGCKEALASGDYAFYLRHCKEMPKLTLDELAHMIRSAGRDNNTGAIDQLLTLSGIHHNGASVFYISQLVNGSDTWNLAAKAFVRMGYTSMIPLLKALRGSSVGIYEAVGEDLFEPIQNIPARWELSPY